MSLVRETLSAYADLVEITSYFDLQERTLSERFLAALDGTVHLLADQPAIGSPVRFDSPALPDLRFFPIQDFPKYLVFYRPITDGIELLRVVHGARDLPALFS